MAEHDEIGTCCSYSDAVSYLEKLDGDPPQRIANLLKYLYRKDKGKKPKFHKGECGKKYDSYTCGNCGRILITGVLENYCHNCGHRVLWDSIRCLTGKDAAEEEQ